MRMHLPCTPHGHPYSSILSQQLHHMIKVHALGDVETLLHRIGVPRWQGPRVSLFQGQKRTLGAKKLQGTPRLNGQPSSGDHVAKRFSGINAY